jgi:non-heme chloroperoxidase
MSLDVRSVDLPTGVTLEYVERGDPSGVPVLFLPGAVGAWNSYELVLKHLPASVRAIALTLRGRGDASKPDTGYSFGETAADIAAFINARHLGPAVLVGHSLSTLYAQRFALDYPEHTHALILVGAVYSVAHTEEEQEFWDTVIAPLEDPIEPELVRGFFGSLTTRPLPQGFFEALVREVLKVPARVWKAIYRPLLEEDHSDELHRVRAPVLLISGSEDRSVTRDQQDALLATIRTSRGVIYEGVGHAPNWETPERFAADVARFVEGLAT